MIPMIIIILFYAPAFLPFLCLILGIIAGMKLSEQLYIATEDHRQSLDRAFISVTDRLLASSLFPSF